MLRRPPSQVESVPTCPIADVARNSTLQSIRKGKSARAMRRVSIAAQKALPARQIQQRSSRGRNHQKQKCLSFQSYFTAWLILLCCCLLSLQCCYLFLHCLCFLCSCFCISTAGATASTIAIADAALPPTSPSTLPFRPPCLPAPPPPAYSGSCPARFCWGSTRARYLPTCPANRIDRSLATVCWKLS